MIIDQEALKQYENRFRALLINSLAGIRQAVLIGTKSKDGYSNLAIFNSLIHIGATQKETFGAHLKLLQQNGVDPDVVTTDAWAYRSLFSKLKDNADPILLIGLEKSKTFFYIHSKNRPVLYREIPFGIKTIERHLQDSFESSPDLLHTWINDIGVSGIDEDVSNAISNVLEFLIPELKQTELATRSQVLSL